MRPQLFNLMASTPTLAAEIAAASQRLAPSAPAPQAEQTLVGDQWVEAAAPDVQRFHVPMVGGLGIAGGFNVNLWAMKREAEALRQAADEAAQETLQESAARGRRRL
ncbi:hypothetical protein [Burkholderia vietnamiensis]|uniref:hypothetical protein n=1 Tax=Burkholderia vietnamiensis TaxID=60552 RepID=UPI001CF17B7D|nr:hypothetical protein [Burkholderia vietnamiensis]MCA8448973.1 hypothetical protein [Burkholderia vietnamiensis]